jgi:lysophospholipase L1-like esterase
MMRIGLRPAIPPLLFLLFSLGACGPDARQEEIDEMRPDTLSFLALGDSYTIGESVDSALRWPVQLSRRLRGAGIPIADPVVLARTGWTTDELAAAMDAAGPLGTYDLVSLLIGVNDQYRGRGPEEYRGQFSELLDRAIGLAGGRPNGVLVLSIPDWGVMPFAAGRNREAIAGEIDAFNAVNLRESRRRGVHYLDVTAISREAGTDSSLVAGDGLHPSGAQYTRWVHAALSVAEGILGLDQG